MRAKFLSTIPLGRFSTPEDLANAALYLCSGRSQHGDRRLHGSGRGAVYMRPVNLAEKLAMFDSHWDPHVVADYNENEVMVVKFAGAFPFHLHEETDDFFLVLEGEMVMDLEGASHPVRAGELIIVPERRDAPAPGAGGMQGSADRAEGRAEYRRSGHGCA